MSDNKSADSKQEMDLNFILEVLGNGNDVIVKAGSQWHKYLESLKADNERLREALGLCQPFMKDLQSENFNDPGVGMFMDNELDVAYSKLEAALNQK